jgi:hypothetical protein
MAPEQARGEEIDYRADLYSLGSVLYAMCTGRPPFEAATALDTIRHAAAGAPRPVREVNPDVPQWLAAVVTRLHAKDPAARPAGAAEVAQELGRHLAYLDRPSLPPHLRRALGYEYRSRRAIGGWPLVHVATGWDPHTGRKRIARGVVAVGDVAVGLIAVGGVAVGGLAYGGFALGLCAVGGGAVAVLLALGGAAVGGIAIGGGAIGYYALGGGALGVHALGGNVQDPAAVEFFRRLPLVGEWVGRIFRGA